MPKAMAAVLALVFVASVTLPVEAQTLSSSDKRQTERIRGKQTLDQAQAAAFAEAASTYEDIVNLYLADRAGAMRMTISSARGMLARLRPFLKKQQTAATLDRHLSEMERDEARGDLNITALTAVESLRQIIGAETPQMRRVPLEVSMYTYWGFRIVVLASAAEINWPQLTLGVTESERNWTDLRKKIRDTNLRVLLEENQRGLSDAVARSDAAGVKFAARVQIASVAVLRDFFERVRAMGRLR